MQKPAPLAARRPLRRALSLLLATSLLAGGCTLEERTDANRVPRNGSDGQDPPRREIVDAEGVARLPVFSSAVRSGNLLFLSGQIGTEPGVEPLRVVEGGPEAEARQTMEHIRTVLAAEGLGMDDVVKCTLFLDDIADYGAVNEVYISFFPNEPPARSAMSVEELALGAALEIECIAAYPEGM